jgi:hypothetical protein
MTLRRNSKLSWKHIIFIGSGCLMYGSLGESISRDNSVGQLNAMQDLAYGHEGRTSAHNSIPKLAAKPILRQSTELPGNSMGSNLTFSVIGAFDSNGSVLGDDHQYEGLQIATQFASSNNVSSSNSNSGLGSTDLTSLGLVGLPANPGGIPAAGGNGRQGFAQTGSVSGNSLSGTKNGLPSVSTDSRSFPGLVIAISNIRCSSIRGEAPTTSVASEKCQVPNSVGEVNNDDGSNIVHTPSATYMVTPTGTYILDAPSDDMLATAIISHTSPASGMLTSVNGSDGSNIFDNNDGPSYTSATDTLAGTLAASSEQGNSDTETADAAPVIGSITGNFATDPDVGFAPIDVGSIGHTTLPIAPASTSIPEPTSMLLIYLGLIGVLKFHGGRFRKAVIGSYSQSRSK